MTLPFLPCRLDWVMYEGVFFTLFLWPISPLHGLPQFVHPALLELFGSQRLLSLLTWTNEPWESPKNCTQTPLLPSTHGAAGMNLSIGNKALT